MKFTCNREALLAAAQLAAQCVPSRDVKPILRNLKISAGEWLELSATDLETGIIAKVQSAKADQAGDILVPAAKLTAILQEAGTEDVTIERSGDNVMVYAGMSEYEMPSEDPKEYPDVPQLDGPAHLVPAGQLQAMVKRVTFACADESARYAMTGVLVEFDKSEVRLVATDGRRLAVDERDGVLGDGVKAAALTVVPRKAFETAAKLMGMDPDGQAKVQCRPNELLIATERGTLYTRLVEGRYPNWKEVLPKKKAHTVTFVASAMEKAARQAKVMIEKESSRVTLSFTKNKCTLTTKGAGRAKVEAAVVYDGKGVDVHLASEYLLELLRALPSDAEVTLDIVDGNTPVLFRLENYRHVIMPLQT